MTPRERDAGRRPPAKAVGQKPDQTVQQKPDQTVLQKPDQTMQQKPVHTGTVPSQGDGERPADATILTPVATDVRRRAVQTLPMGLRLGQELGRGGFGLVNLATQQVFGRDVAVKSLISADSDEARRFYAEAIVTANLQHPNIVPILDLTQDANGRLQLVMKVIEGLSWRKLLRPRTPEQKLRAQGTTLDDHLDILIKVCDAVAFAHARGILHRDLKLENVMVGAFGEVQVMDWGCAVAFGSKTHHEAIPRVEHLSHISGTPSYMPPESVLRRTDLIGPHTDVYLLGGCLYHVLTGTSPHLGEEVNDVLSAALASVIQPPNERAPEREIPDELAWIAMAALVRDPAERTRTVAVFEQQLKDYRTHAQASRLTAVTVQLIADAQRYPERADELLRRAMSAADNAVELWPERTAGLKVQLQATTEYMQLTFARSDFSASASAAARAQELAGKLHDEPAEVGAAEALARARAAGAAQAARVRHVLILRYCLMGAAVVVALGLIIGLAVVSSEKHQVEQALAAAQTSDRERTAADLHRLAEQRRAAPGLVAQVHELVIDKRLDDAEHIAAIAAAFDPELPDAHALLACLRAARGGYDDAHLEIAQWARTAAGDPHPAELAELCERAQRLSGSTQMPPDLIMAFGEFFAGQHLGVLAERRLLTPEQRLAIYRLQVEAAWPGSGAGMGLAPDGMLHFDGLSATQPCLSGRSDVTDLHVLAGLPLATLSLDHTGVFDLQPLAGSKLVELNLASTKVRDLSCLASCPELAVLNISSTEIQDLRPVATPHLRQLYANSALQLRDIALLAQSPIERLDISNTGVSDLQPMSRCRLNMLRVSHCPISDWSLLHGFPLQNVDVSWTSFDDRALALLQGPPLETLNLGSSRVTTLGPLHDLTHLVELVCSGLPITDLTPLAGAPLRLLKLNSTRVTELALLKTMHQLTDLDLSATSLSDDWLLSGLHLTRLRVGQTRLSELSALNLSAMSMLTIDDTRIADLSPLKQSPLILLFCRNTPVASLKPIASLSVVTLDLGGSLVSDLSPLHDMISLRKLSIDHLPVRDVRPIASLPIEVLILGPFTHSTAIEGLDELRSNTHLKTIGEFSTSKGVVLWPAAEFWKQLDSGALYQFN